MNEIIDNETGEYTNEPVEFVSGAVAAEISQQVATAKRYPRRADKAISTEIMSRATLDEDTAAECCYSLPRAGKDIVGPSVRFAELVFASYGNMRAGARFVELDTKDPQRSAVIVEGVCIDLQMNNAQSVPVRRSITGKRGVFNADMTNIAFSAGAAIARREAILKTVPKSIWGAAWKGVLAVLQGDQRTLAARRKSSLDAFAKMGVEASRVFVALDVPGEEGITLEHMPRLIGMWTALRDGTETIDSLFSRGAPGHDVVKNPLKDAPKDSVSHRATQGDPGYTASNDPIGTGKPTNPDANEKHPEAGHGDLGAPETAQDASEPAGTDTPADQKTAQASPAGAGKAVSEPEPQYTDAASYIVFMEAGLAAAKAGSAVTELWGSTRADRAQLLNDEQLDDLTEKKATRIKALKKGAS